MKKETRIIEVTEEEYDLLESIRNYNKSFPDGYPELLWYAQQLFDAMLKQPYSKQAPLRRGIKEERNNDGRSNDNGKEGI